MLGSLSHWLTHGWKSLELLWSRSRVHIPYIYLYHTCLYIYFRMSYMHHVHTCTLTHRHIVYRYSKWYSKMLLYQYQLAKTGRRQEEYMQIALLSLIAYALLFLVITPGWAHSWFSNHIQIMIKYCAQITNESAKCPIFCSCSATETYITAGNRQIDITCLFFKVYPPEPSQYKWNPPPQKKQKDWGGGGARVLVAVSVWLWMQGMYTLISNGEICCIVLWWFSYI